MNRGLCADKNPTQKLRLHPIILKIGWSVSFLCLFARTVTNPQSGSTERRDEQGGRAKVVDVHVPERNLGKWGKEWEERATGESIKVQQEQQEWRTQRFRVTELGCCCVFCICVSVCVRPEMTYVWKKTHICYILLLVQGAEWTNHFPCNHSRSLEIKHLNSLK